MRATVFTVGAYDRFNYGDLLFPLILDYASERLGRSGLGHLATVSADMSPAGGVEVHAVSSADGIDQWQGLILGGGEVLSATWSQALINFAPFPFDFALRAIRKLAGERLTNPIARVALRGTWPTPYVPSAELCRQVPVAVNAVGASSITNLRGKALTQVLGAMAAASYVSVRDEIGVAALAARGISAEVAPDSVAILAEMWPKPDPGEGSTAVFQCSQQWLWDSGDVTVQLAGIASRFDRIVLLPIGLAGGHGDQLALRRIRAGLQKCGIDPVRVGTNVSVRQIAEHIASADLFIGSSLHGAITAMAYGVPHVALDQVGKLSAYIGTWGDGLTPFDVPAGEIYEASARASAVPRDQLAERGRRLAARSRENTARVLEAARA